MNDLATVLDMQGQHQEALGQVRRAVELGKEAGHPDQHVLLGNMAGILLHQGERLCEGGARDFGRDEERWFDTGAACSIEVKLLDLDPQGQWFDPWRGHNKICTAVGPLSKALNPTLLEGVSRFGVS